MSFWAECCWWLGGQVLSPVRIPFLWPGSSGWYRGRPQVTVFREQTVDGGEEPLTALQSTPSSCFHLVTLPLLWNSAGSSHPENNYAFSSEPLQLCFHFLTNLFLYLSYVPRKLLNLLDIDPPLPDCPQPLARFLFLNFFCHFSGV